MRRRDFLGGSPLVLLGSRFACAAHPPETQTAAGNRDLTEELSASEIETVDKSAMARDLDNFFGKGFS